MYCCQCTVSEEVTVPSGKVRADVVAVNGHVVAYEIKSDFDSIKRLTTQIPEYDKNFGMIRKCYSVEKRVYV